MTFFEATLKMPSLAKGEPSPSGWRIQTKLKTTAAREELGGLRRRAESYEIQAREALEYGSFRDALVAVSKLICTRIAEAERRVINASEAEQFHWRGNLNAVIDAIAVSCPQSKS